MLVPCYPESRGWMSYYLLETFLAKIGSKSILCEIPFVVWLVLNLGIFSLAKSGFYSFQGLNNHACIQFASCWGKRMLLLHFSGESSFFHLCTNQLLLLKYPFSQFRMPDPRQRMFGSSFGWHFHNFLCWDGPWDTRRHLFHRCHSEWQWLHKSRRYHQWFFIPRFLSAEYSSW